MSIPKRHHYLPESYLKGFVHSKKIWVYDRVENEYRFQSPKDTTVVKHYYAFIDAFGKNNVQIEKFLSQIEGMAKPIILRLDNGEKITQTDKEILSGFVALLFTRVPGYRDMINDVTGQLVKKINKIIFSDKQQAEKLLEDFIDETGYSDTDVTVSDLMEFAQKEDYTVDLDKGSKLKSMLEVSEDLAGYFIQMDWVIFHSPSETSFITTDSPFNLFPPNDYNPKNVYGFGVITPGTKKVIPLSQRSCLFILDYGTDIETIKANKVFVRNVNHHNGKNFDRFLLGRDERHIRSIVKKININTFSKGPRFQID